MENIKKVFDYYGRLLWCKKILYVVLEKKDYKEPHHGYYYASPDILMIQSDKTCPTGKQCYDSYQHAHTAMQEINQYMRMRKCPRGDKLKSPYRCPECGQWHLTSMGRKR